jgi:hypothetical protein
MESKLSKFFKILEQEVNLQEFHQHPGQIVNQHTKEY